jgi:hypothetical protein
VPEIFSESFEKSIPLKVGATPLMRDKALL